MSDSDHLASLNPAQRLAVTAPDGPTLVLAGAGSGKTRAIIHRMAHLVLDRNVAAETILALTFTNRAAGEMKRRVLDLLGGTNGGPLPGVFTFHALSLRLLRQFGSDIGLMDGFTLYASDDRTRLLRRVCRDFSLSERDYSVGRIGAAVSALKHEGFGGKLFARNERERELLTRVAAEYQLRMEKAGAVDFDDLLLRALELLECSERCQRHAEHRFQHVLVDEYQDTNRVQYRMLRLLAPHANVFVVGDEDQSIYNFRGADLRNILDFEQDFNNATTVKLELNYRSTKPILDAANAVIAHNTERKGKVLTASVRGGEVPEHWSFSDDAQEASQIAEQIGRIRNEDETAKIGVLFRTHAQSRLLEEALLVRNLPHLVVGGMRFYERKEIRDAVAYLKLVLNPADDASFSRVVNVPSRGVGASSVGILESLAQDNDCSLWEASGLAIERGALSGRGRSGTLEFRARLDALRKLAETVPLAELVEQSLEMTGLNRAFDREGPEQAETRRENLYQLVAAAEEFEHSVSEAKLSDFVDNLGLLSDIDTLDEFAPCLLMTLHSAKGLEFDVVFMPGMEEGLFPHMRAIGNRAGVEEERRLCYVGMTRARRRLVLSQVQLRRTGYRPQVQSPSRFLREIPQAGLDSLSFVRGQGESDADDESLFVERMPVASTRHSPDSGMSGPRTHQSRIRTGVSVRHPKFGEGLVVATSGSGPDQRITVQFHRAGRKRLVAQYAKLQVV